MYIDTSRFRAPTITSPTVNLETTNNVSEEGSQKVNDLRISIANKLGISETELSGNPTISETNKKVEDILLKYQSARTSATEESTLLDVYSLMQLIQEMAQKMRDATREMRQLESQVIQANIQSQAEQQRTAAMTQMITSVVTFCIQVGITAAGTAKQLSALGQETNAKAAQGVDVAKQQADIARMGNSPEAIQNKIDSLNGTNSSNAPKIDTSKLAEGSKVEGGKVESNATNSQFKEIDSKFAEIDNKGTTLKENVTAKETALKDANKAQAVQEFDDAIKEYNVANDNLEAAKATNDPAKEAAAMGQLRIAGQKVEVAQKNVTNGTPVNKDAAGIKAAENDLNAAKTELSEFEKQVTTHYDDVVAHYENEYNKALSEVNSQRDTNNGKVDPESQKKLDECGNKLVYARAKQVQHLQNLPDGATKINQLSNQLSSSLSNKLQEAGIDANKTSKVVIYGTLMTNVSKMVSDLGQQVGNTIAEFQRTKATEMQADQKVAEEQLDQLRDMFQQLLNTLEKAIQLYQNVAQKESQSVEEISGAIRG